MNAALSKALASALATDTRPRRVFPLTLAFKFDAAPYEGMYSFQPPYHLWTNAADGGNVPYTEVLGTFVKYLAKSLGGSKAIKERARRQQFRSDRTCTELMVLDARQMLAISAKLQARGFNLLTPVDSILTSKQVAYSAQISTEKELLDTLFWLVEVPI